MRRSYRKGKRLGGDGIRRTLKYEEEETSVRSIEKDINSQVTEFQQKYTDKDKLDLVIMVLLTKAFELDKIQSLEDDITQAHAQIDTLESTLDQLM